GVQWGLVAPLIEEFAAGGMRGCSVFLVGDDKQSLYGFRRASPGLLREVGTWLQERAGARLFEQNCSRRSSGAIIDVVNAVFDEQQLLPSFRRHTTVWPKLWGQVLLQPLITRRPETSAPPGEWRDPGVTPRPVATDDRYREEAQLLVRCIKQYVGSLRLGEDGTTAGFGDILILLRDRRSAEVYEDALRAAQIPYLGTAQTDPLESLELRDLLDLMAFLINPADDRALAGVLRAPLFDMHEDLLLMLAQHAQADHSNWWPALQSVASAPDAPAALVAAARRLQSWLAHVDRIPAHDLLDCILHETDAPNAYRRKLPPHLQARAQHHLQQFLSAALEFDGGRFPSLTRFREALLHRLQPLSGDQEHQDRVRVLTVHGAKGLEAPIVFLVDAARHPVPTRDARAVVDWPAGEPAPRRFHFAGVKDDVDDVSTLLLQQQAHGAAQEDLNALYVALTRARQLLIVSGCEPHNPPETPSWYQRVEAALMRLGVISGGDRTCTWTSGISVPPAAAGPAPPVAGTPVAAPPRFHRAPTSAANLPSAAARTGTDTAERRALRAGQAIHKLLQYRTQGLDASAAQACAAREFSGFHPSEWRRFADEVQQLLSDPRWRHWFDPAQYERAHNEISIAYQTPAGAVTGTLDRLIVTADVVTILDYKTHRNLDPAAAAQVAVEYQPQMQRYVEGVRRLWPHRVCRSYLLFTAIPQAIESAGFNPEN
ncbi:MAG TPA: 3'-5' exonuclease, partial [Acidiferrobacteraceae bacterium]|nr:3'-5' exonuclease [Acidiferrobacteraceae bacterium]